MRLAREAISLTQDAFNEQFGYGSVRTYQKNEAGINEAGVCLAASFVRAGINANWLLTGEGPMLLSEMTLASEKMQYVQSPVMKLTQEQLMAGYVALPLYNNVHAAAGHGAVVGHEVPDDALIFKEEWIRYELGANPADLCLIRVSGDSMEPTLRAGEVILVDRRAVRPDREGIYILRMGEMLLVKRLQAIPGGMVKVTSDNTAFDPWTLNLTDIGSEVAIVGRVVWSGRRH